MKTIYCFGALSFKTFVHLDYRSEPLCGGTTSLGKYSPPRLLCDGKFVQHVKTYFMTISSYSLFYIVISANRYYNPVKSLKIKSVYERKDKQMQMLTDFIIVSKSYSVALLLQPILFY